MKALKCIQCGGDINPITGQCEYCKTKFLGAKTDSRIKGYPPGVHVLTCEMTVPFNVRSTLNQSQGLAIAAERAVMELGEKIRPYIELKCFESIEDPLGDMKIIASLKVYGTQEGAHG